MNNVFRFGAYALTVVLLGFYAVVMWWMVHPTAPPDFQAYYIDQTTTCMNQPVPGTYSLGSIVSYLPDGAEAAKPTKPCGWEGPAGDGTHAVGTESRLRFDFPEPARGALTLALDLVAIKKDGVAQPQSVDITVNGRHIETLRVNADAPQHFELRLPASLVLAAKGKFELQFAFPTAVNMGKNDPESRWRSVKLLAAGLLPTS